MVIGIIGENCSGKSTLAEAIKDAIGAEIITGKDYLRMAKSENEAILMFKTKLKDALLTDKNIIYVISEKEHISLIPDGAVRILVKADIDTIKERFKKRMRGNLPAPVEQMLERKHGMFDNEMYDYRFDGVSGNLSEICHTIKQKII
ncbi:MAG: hypothetical protein K2O22_03380 [Anaeroplasmataceae bacterium]|nr:hypothetical protein [Anaeroplasmataceae bacterium]